MKPLKVAVEGCCHGELDAIYKQIAWLENKHKYKVDVLLICGDFQAIRNQADLQCMAVPPKYRTLGGFHKYYTGEKKAPMLTIVIGGNHEASNYFWELYHGGWIAPNMYYLGSSGCVLVNGIRIAGSSGIFNFHHYRNGNFETLPYTDSSMRSIYHTRQYCITKLSLLSLSPDPIDVMLSHDWPQHIPHHGDLRRLTQAKPFFKADIQSGKLGSPPLMKLLKVLKPRKWFSAHLHVRFEAVVKHGGEEPETLKKGMEEVMRKEEENPDEIVIDEEGDVVVVEKEKEKERDPNEIVMDAEEDEVDVRPAPPTTNPDVEAAVGSKDDGAATNNTPAPPSDPLLLPPPSTSNVSETHFIALDKCLPKRQYLEIFDIPTSHPPTPTPIISYDPTWLAITKALHPYLSLSHDQSPLPDAATARSAVEKELEWVKANIPNLEVEATQVFAMTAPGPAGGGSGGGGGKGGGGGGGRKPVAQPPAYCNPQTEAFCEMLGIENKINEDGLRISFGATRA